MPAVEGEFRGRAEDVSMADEPGSLRIWRHSNSHRPRLFPTTTSTVAQLERNQGSAYSCGEAGHWSRDCPLTTGLSAEVPLTGGVGRKLSVSSSDFEYFDEDVDSFHSVEGEDSGFERFVHENNIIPLVRKGSFPRKISFMSVLEADLGSAFCPGRPYNLLSSYLKFSDKGTSFPRLHCQNPRFYRTTNPLWQMSLS